MVSFTILAAINKNIKYQIMRKLIFKATFLLLMIFSVVAYAQNTVSGTVVDSDGNPIPGVTVFISEKSAPYLEGTTLDYKETLMGGGFSFENPNPLWIDDLSKAVADVISEKVNPVVATHGGHVDLIGIDDGKAVISFGGGCQGCGMVDVTLRQGVEVMITEGVPGVSGVIDVTDHEAGTNPFY